MKSIVSICSRVALLLVLVLALPACRTKKPDGTWKALFDGRSLDGWKMVGPGEFRLERGELVTYGGMGMLCYTREMLGDCRILVVFKPTTGHDNSGVFIRIPEVPTDPWFAVNRGYEVQIENSGDAWHRTGTLYSMSEAKRTVHARVNEWNIMVITLEGKRTRVELNDVLITDFNEGDAVPAKTKDYEPERGSRPTAGYIGLQNHDDNTRVHFREVSVSPLR